MSGIVFFTSGDTKVKKLSRGLLIQETDREKVIVSENCSGSTEKRVSSSSGKVLSWVLKNEKCLFLQRGRSSSGREWHVQSCGTVMVM